MIIAHAPLGYLLAYSSQRWWSQSFTALQRRWIFAVAAIAGAFPDIDLFYFYFINSQVSHRQFITHSALPYLIILIIGIVLCQFQKLRYPAWLVIFFSIGAFSHLAADMLIGQVNLLAPFSHHLYGLVSASWYRTSVFMRYSFATNFLAEFIIMVLAALTFTQRKRFWLKLGVVAACCVSFVLLYINNHIYKPSGYYYYSDQDNDGVLAAQDRDSDGDGLMNIVDEDIDNDGEDNSLDFYKETFSAQGSLYDYTNGIFIEIPLRLGYVNNVTLVQRLFANVGIFFTTEMAYDYSIQPTGYIDQPNNNRFADWPDNWKVWLEHTGKLIDPSAKVQEYDLLFFANGEVGVALSSETNAETVLIADSHSWQTQIASLAQLQRRLGPLTHIGRILPKPLSKQY